MGNKKTNERNKKNKRKSKGKRFRKILLILILILSVAGAIFAYRVHLNGGGVSGMLATVVGHDGNTRKNLGEFKCLILGISTDQENVDLTDTIIVASYNPNTQKATLLSIPRDTYTGKNPAKATAYEKINALYSRKHRPDETLKAVNDITGLNIQYYMVVKTEALIKLVDVIGGVTFNVPIDMNYDDSSQNLHIHLKAGEQTLDGDKAEQVLRFRHNNNGTSYPEEYGDNDIGRMRTQREFISQVIKQTAKPENIFKIGQILDVAKEYVITNINFDVAKDYIPYAVEFSTENLTTDVLPGVPSNKNDSGTWVYIHNKTQTTALIQKIFFDRDLTEEELNNPNTDIKNSSNVSNKKNDIKIEVLNGSEKSQNLQTVVTELSDMGYNVSRTGTTNTTSKTIIINKKDKENSTLEQLKDILGVGTIQKSESSSSKVDITIIIGKDFK